MQARSTPSFAGRLLDRRRDKHPSGRLLRRHRDLSRQTFLRTLPVRTTRTTNRAGRNIETIMSTSVSGLCRGNGLQCEAHHARRHLHLRRIYLANLRPRCCIRVLGTRRQRLSTAGVRSTCSTGTRTRLWTTHRAISISTRTRVNMTMAILTAMTTASTPIRSKSGIAVISSSNGSTKLTTSIHIRI